MNLRKALISSVATLPLLTATALASAATYYARPTGSGTACSAATPCSLASGIAKLASGDTLLLHDGIYAGSSVPTWGFNVTASGTSSAWTTIAAAPGALPIIVGGGPSNNTGLGASTATYVQFIGIVVQNFNTGFANGWTGTGHVNDSNGHLRFINCIADGNGKNGIAFQSATGVLVSECIVAHNGGQADYASSGVDLFGARGTYADNIVERTVAFENADTADHSDGSGFIVDDVGTGATFINNLGFRNGGSCIRLTQSTGTRIINNTCYANGLDVAATNPTSPGEIFFSSAVTQTGVLMVNNVAVATGSTQDKQAFFNAPTTNVSNNYTKNDGTIAHWLDATGTHPDFGVKGTASELIDKATATNAPSDDIGFDPKCVTKGVPAVVGTQAWYQYSIDYDYIRSLGGVAGCFNPKARSGTPDIGAYEYGSGSGGSGGGGTGGVGGVSSGGGGAGGSGGASTGGGGSGGAVGGAGAGSGGTAGGAGTSSGGSAGTSSGGSAGTSSGGSAGTSTGGGTAGGAGTSSGGTAGASSGGSAGTSGGGSAGTSSGGSAGTSSGSDSGGTSSSAGDAGTSPGGASAGTGTGGDAASSGGIASGGSASNIGGAATGGATTGTMGGATSNFGGGGSGPVSGGGTATGGAPGAGQAGFANNAGSGFQINDIAPEGTDGCTCGVAGDKTNGSRLGLALGAAAMAALYRRRRR